MPCSPALIDASGEYSSSTLVTSATGSHSSVPASTQCAEAPLMRSVAPPPGGTVLTSLTPETTKTTLPVSAIRITWSGPGSFWSPLWMMNPSEAGNVSIESGLLL